MKTRDCDVYRELIADHEWLDEREQALLEAHAAECDHCLQELEAVQALAQVFREDALAQMPQNLTERIMRSVGSESADTAASRGHLFSLGIAAAVFVVVAVASLFHPTWTPLAMDWLSSLVTEWSSADVFGGVVPDFRGGAFALGIPELAGVLSAMLLLCSIVFLDSQRERSIR
ncbi:MAG: hypothetical protein KAI66_09805 [Lentisphaeria bacterium]|nr:hypothetical protein [Lentisphaeria bacterium]